MNSLAFQDKTLVLGAGEVGLATAQALIEHGCTVHIHCRRKASLQSALERLPKEGVAGGSYGDLAFGLTPLVIDGGEVDAASCFRDCHALLTGEIAQQRFASITRITGVQSVVDCMNLATHLSDPSAWPTVLSRTEEPAMRDAAGLASSLAVIRGHGMAIDSWLYQSPGSNYVKVSTTGLGCRGLEVPFTHGDTGDVLSPVLWRKLFIAGANHQLLWALSRTFPDRVRLVVPAAFIGFEDIEDVLEMDSNVVPQFVWAGEDRAYTSEEIAVISSHHQMGTVTKGEVAAAVVRVLSGAGHDVDMLRAMTAAVVPASDRGREQRQQLLERMRSRTLTSGPVSSGSLGRRVDIALNALRTLRVIHGKDRPLRALLQDRQGDGDCGTRAGGAPFTPDQIALLDWIADVLYGNERRLPEEDVAGLRALLDSADWGEGDLLALLWRGDGARTALL